MKMKKDKTNIIIVLISIIIISTGALLINTLLDPYYRPDKDKMEKYFKRDRDDIVLVADYFASSSSSLLIYFNSGKNRKNIIKDEKVLAAMNRLFKERRYSTIGKDGNTIYFIKWTRGADVGIGIAYSINKEYKPTIEYLTKLEPLSEEGWYFYEADYNEWRL